MITHGAYVNVYDRYAQYSAPKNYSDKDYYSSRLAETPVNTDNIFGQSSNLYNFLSPFNKSLSSNTTFGRDVYSLMTNVTQQASAAKSAMNMLGGLERYSSLFENTAVPSNSDVLSVDLSKNASVYNGMKTTVEVGNLASSQINRGASLGNDQNSFGSAFSLTIENSRGTASFTVDLDQNATNRSAQEQMAAKINSADIGIKASVVVDEQTNTSSLLLESIETGASNGFNVVDEGPAMLDNVTQEAQNARFLVDGFLRESESNSVTLYNGINAQLTSEGTTTISYQKDTKAAVDYVENFANAFNSLVEEAKDSPALSKQLSNLTTNFSQTLSNAGIEVKSDGTLSVNAERAERAIESGAVKQAFQGVNSFGNKFTNIANNAGKTAYVNNSFTNNFMNQYLISPNAYMGQIVNLLA